MESQFAIIGGCALGIALFQVCVVISNQIFNHKKLFNEDILLATYSAKFLKVY